MAFRFSTKPNKIAHEEPKVSLRAHKMMMEARRAATNRKEPTKKRRTSPPSSPPGAYVNRRKMPQQSSVGRLDFAAARRAAAASVRRCAQSSVVVVEEDSGEWRDPEDEDSPTPARTERIVVPEFYGNTPKVVGQRAFEDYDDASKLLCDRLYDRLRPHQRRGCEFACRLVERGGGCLIADEMGLGKTATTLATLAVLVGVEGSANVESVRAAYRCVIACPASVAATWLDEAKKWLTPTDRRAGLMMSGGHAAHVTFFADVGDALVEARNERRRRRLAARGRADWGRDDLDDAVERFERAPLECKPVLVVSYEAYRAQAERINAIRDVGLLICDEAHRLKGGDATETYDAINASSATRRILVSATPVHNGIEELKALLALAGIVDGDDRERDLGAVLSACALRRSVRDTDTIRKAMPRKTDALVLCRPTQRQLDASRSILGRDRGRAALSAVSAACLACSHLNDDDDIDLCGKWHVAAPLLALLRESGKERVVLVSRFKSVLRAAAKLAVARGWVHATIDGDTSLDERARVQSRLNDHSSDFFLALVSLRAGGVGMNLVGASRCILFEPSWNPMDDDQAIARVWRFGQTRPVVVYRLATARSIEERILTRQTDKRKLADQVRQRCATDTLLLFENDDDFTQLSSTTASSQSNLKELVSLAAPDRTTPCDTFTERARTFNPNTSLSFDPPLQEIAATTSSIVYVHREDTNYCNS